MAEIGIIGAGSWGTALAVLCVNNGHDVTVWSRTKRDHKKRQPPSRRGNSGCNLLYYRSF